MAIGDAYATTAQYKAQTGKTGTADDTSLTSSLLAVSRVIDRACRRSRTGFNKDSAPVVRDFNPEWADPVLRVGDVVSVTAITVDTALAGTYATTVASGDYELLPLNSADGPEAKPYDEIGLLPWSTTLKQWVPGQRVRVNAVWGWNAVPAAITNACIELTAILRLESPRGTNTVNELNQVLSTSRAAQNILAALMETYAAPPGMW